MKHFIFVLAAILLGLPVLVDAQLTHLGLTNKRTSKIELRNNEIFVASNDGLYQKSLTNSDTTWNSIGLQGREITDFIVFNMDTILASTNTVYNTDDTISLFITYDGGENWNNFQNGFSTGLEHHTCTNLEYNRSGPDTLFARSFYGISKSIDRGLSWVQVSGFGAATIYDNMLYEINSNFPNIVWASGSSMFFQPYVLKSTDYGNTWEAIFIYAGGDNTCASLLAHPNNSNEVVIGLGDQIQKSIDGGVNWETTYNSTSYDFILELELSPNTSNLIYATGSDGENGNNLLLCKSYDFGTTWEKESYDLGYITYAYDIEINSVSNKDYLLIATNKGVLQLADSTTNINQNAVQNKNEWTIYPNPIKENAILSFRNIKNGPHSLALFNAYGSLVKRIDNITTNEILISKNGLSSGVYYFQFSFNNKNVATGKFIVN